MNKFFEQQQFNQKWVAVIYILLVGLLLMFLYADFVQIILGHPFGDKPASNTVLIIITLFILLLFIILKSTALVTCIDTEGVKYKWIPFRRKYLIINWNAIKELSIDEGKSLGWGYSINTDTKINNVKGNTCFKIELINGNKIIIGTQKGDELK